MTFLHKALLECKWVVTHHEKGLQIELQGAVPNKITPEEFSLLKAFEISFTKSGSILLVVPEFWSLTEFLGLKGLKAKVKALPKEWESEAYVCLECISMHQKAGKLQSAVIDFLATEDFYVEKNLVPIKKVGDRFYYKALYTEHQREVISHLPTGVKEIHWAGALINLEADYWTAEWDESESERALYLLCLTRAEVIECTQ